ncbi:unnamed protein product [Paramecium pentaurelia]|uniref:Transmembrane protein n=1 Tax=Paramecium pentaurelia TaxID=43138 RepID=A0A8S1VV84_9CILI|nr:unnamed protein product [Paramecium pentaurelia]
MKKKLSLQFALPGIEKAYQLDRLIKNGWMRKILSILLLLFALARLITSIVQGNNEVMYWEICFACYSIFLVGVSFKGTPEKVKSIFSFTNNLLCVLQVCANYYKYPQCIYINGQNVMIFNMTMFYFSSIQEAPIQLIVFLGSRLLISGLVNDFFIVQDFIQIIITTLCILLFIYQNDQNQRAHFQLQFSDKQWEQTLPVIIQNPFLMFTFDDERINFNLKLQNDMQKIFWDNEKAPSENLRSFLRSYKMGNDNLEQYILNRTRSCSDYKKIFLHSLRIQRFDQESESKKTVIRLSDFYLGQQVFLIEFDQHEQKIRQLSKLKDALIQGINQHQNLTINFLKKQLNLMQNAINSKNTIEHIYKLKIHCMYFIGKYTQCNSFQDIEEKIQQINITEMVKDLIHTYSMAYKHIQIEFSSNSFEDIYGLTNQQLLNIFLVILFQTFVRLNSNGKTIFVHLADTKSNSEFQLIKISILFDKTEEFKQKLINNQLFYKIQVRLSPKVDIINLENSSQFLIYKNLQQLNDIRMLEEEIE